jgi:hypothetical protein
MKNPNPNVASKDFIGLEVAVKDTAGPKVVGPTSIFPMGRDRHTEIKRNRFPRVPAVCKATSRTQKPITSLPSFIPS